MSQTVILSVGFPACGKSSLSKKYEALDFVILSRDTEGGLVSDLAPKLDKLLSEGKSVFLDNTNCTIEHRKPFIDVCKKHGVPIQAIHLDTSLEDCQINALNRMWDRYGMIFYTAKDIADHPQAKSDPNIFPAAALFAIKKQFEKPTIDEGFKTVWKHPFVRRPYDGTMPAVIFDYDGTLRDVKAGSPYKYPTSIDHVELLPGRVEKLKELTDQGILILGVSNQSGIAKGHLTKEVAVQCFDHTNKLLGVSIEVYFCEHRIPPMTCYCRKPQSGLAVELIRKYYLDPAKVTFVGDMTTDKTFAQRAGFTFVDQADYFG